MTTWEPALSGSGPRYVAIADALERDVGSGRLAAGFQLPTHRDLADALGVTVGTVSRAYRTAEKRGLLRGEVGRGTFVRAAHEPPRRLEPVDDGFINMAVNFMPHRDAEAVLAATLAELTTEGLSTSLVGDYLNALGRPSHREAGCRLVARYGIDVEPDRVLLTNGAQHGIIATMMALTQPGDTILTGEVTYPGVISMARLLGRTLSPVAMDDEGLRPDSVEAACRAHHPKMLYVMPHIQNPRTCVLPEARRAAIAKIAEKYDVAIVEDDTYGFLMEDYLPSISTMTDAFFITSLSKSVAPGLRVGYVVAPEGEVGRIADALWASNVMVSGLNAEIATRWIDNGVAQRLGDERRRESVERRAMTRALLEGHDLDYRLDGYHLWLTLPSNWKADAFVACAAQQGVAVMQGDRFAVGDDVPPSVRVSIGSPAEQSDLERGLRLILQTLNGVKHPPPVV